MKPDCEDFTDKLAAMLPFDRVKRAKRAAEKTIFRIRSDETRSWRAAFPEYTDMQLPGVVLKGARYREGLTQKQLSQLTGIPQRHLSEMENGKRPIGKKNAELLAKALNVPSYKISYFYEASYDSILRTVPVYHWYEGKVSEV